MKPLLSLTVDGAQRPGLPSGLKVRLTHLDGKLPNLALMKLSHWHKQRGDTVTLVRHPSPSLFEQGGYDIVYGSTIFSWSSRVAERLLLSYPDAIVRGTGTSDYETVESYIGVDEYEHYDYSCYPDFPFSIGFSQRGCRLNCGFCVVPKKEGKPRSVNTINDIWRGGDTPKCIVLLDNDFFGQPRDEWQARIEELREGKFRVSFNQGINIRMVNEESAAAIASVKYYDDQFKARRIYTAWDNVGQERVFFRGLEALKTAGVRPSHVMVYMLIGYAPGETLEDVFHRYRMLKEAGCKPYPMVYNNINRELKKFQRWVIRRYDEFIPWEKFKGAVL